MAVNTLYDYYTQNGGQYAAYGSAQRTADATAAGIANYTGDPKQNATLLAYLQAPKTAATPTGSATTTTWQNMVDSGKYGAVVTSPLGGGTGTGTPGAGGGGGGGGADGGIITPNKTTNISTGNVNNSYADAINGVANNLPKYTENPEVKKLLDSLSQSGVDISTLIGKVSGEMGTVSGDQASVDKFINDAIESQKKSMEANKQAAEANFNVENDYTLTKLEAQKTAMQEQGRGNAQAYYAMQLADKEIEHSIRDLEQRKLEAISSGNAKAYDTISQLQLKQIEMRMDAKNKYIQNLTSMAGMVNQRANVITDTLNAVRGLDSDKLNYQIESSKLKLDTAKNINDAINESLRIKIMEREVAVKETDSNTNKRIASPGWSDYSLENTTTTAMYAGINKINELYADDPTGMFNAYKELFNQYKSVLGANATPEAIASKFGGTVDSKGELVSVGAGNFVLNGTGAEENQNNWFFDQLSRNISNMTMFGLAGPLISGIQSEYEAFKVDPNTGEMTYRGFPLGEVSKKKT